MKNRNVRLNTVIALFISIVMGTSSCTDATIANFRGLGSEFKIEMINCDGTVARTWISSGKVSSDSSSDGYFFMDRETGKLVEVTGRLVITKQ